MLGAWTPEADPSCANGSPTTAACARERWTGRRVRPSTASSQRPRNCYGNRTSRLRWRVQMGNQVSTLREEAARSSKPNRVHGLKWPRRPMRMVRSG
jgi:hypothetical protein